MIDFHMKKTDIKSVGHKQENILIYDGWTLLEQKNIIRYIIYKNL